MASCTNCGETIPLGKSLSGRSIDKSQDCPSCGEELYRDSGRLIEK